MISFFIRLVKHEDFKDKMKISSEIKCKYLKALNKKLH